MIIGICGAKGAGKDTACMTLQSQIPMFKNATRIAFADKLKITCAKALRLSEMLFFDEVFKEKEFVVPLTITAVQLREIFSDFGIIVKETPYNFEDGRALLIFKRGLNMCRNLITPRQILQIVGTNILREYDSLIHIRAALRNYKPSKVFIVTDMRFMNEFLYLLYRASSFVGLYVNNPVLEIQKMSLINPHSSELGYKQFSPLCLEIENDSSLEEFRWRVETMGLDLLPFFTARRLSETN